MGQTTGDTGPLHWPNRPPPGDPIPASKSFAGITFPGPWSSFATADTWYPSWAADGKLYSPYMDGLCEGSGSFGGTPNPLATLGTAVISGDDPTNLTIICSMRNVDRTGWDGRYASASLSYQGTWYYGSYTLNSGPQPGGRACTGTYCTLGPFVGFDISTDGGLTWQLSPHTTSSPLFGESIEGGHRVRLGALHVVDFGQELRGSPDGYAYLVGHGGGGPSTDNTWVSGDAIYLVRVKPTPTTINDPHAYEFYAGAPDGPPAWSHSITDLRPLLTWPSHLGSTTITYDAPLRTYLLWVTSPTAGSYDTGGTYDQILLEAPSLAGPWRQVHYLPKFGPQAYFLNVPSKFISADGRRMWLSYSANYQSTAPADPPGSGYSFVLRELSLDGPGPTGAPPPSQTAPRRPAVPLTAPRCTRRGSPTTRLARRLSLTRSSALITGTSVERGCGRVTEVDVSIARIHPRHRCQFLDAAGRLGRVRSCRRPILIVAQGTKRWTVRLRPRGLIPGPYLIRSRARDQAATRERRLSRANGRRVRVH